MRKVVESENRTCEPAGIQPLVFWNGWATYGYKKLILMAQEACHTERASETTPRESTYHTYHLVTAAMHALSKPHWYQRPKQDPYCMRSGCQPHRSAGGCSGCTQLKPILPGGLSGQLHQAPAHRGLWSPESQDCQDRKLSNLREHSFCSAAFLLFLYFLCLTSVRIVPRRRSQHYSQGHARESKMTSALARTREVCRPLDKM